MILFAINVNTKDQKGQRPMSDPLPADILATARAAYLQPCFIDGTDGDFIQSIARAIAAERERCAKIAEDKPRDPCGSTDNPWTWPRDIAAAIRRPLTQKRPAIPKDSGQFLQGEAFTEQGRRSILP